MWTFFGDTKKLTPFGSSLAGVSGRKLNTCFPFCSLFVKYLLPNDVDHFLWTFEVYQIFRQLIGIWTCNLFTVYQYNFLEAFLWFSSQCTFFHVRALICYIIKETLYFAIDFFSLNLLNFSMMYVWYRVSKAIFMQFLFLSN